MRFLPLLLTAVSVAALSACGTTQITNLSRAFADVPYGDPTEPAGGPRVAVAPFEDVREETIVLPGFNVLPGIGLFLMGVPDEYARPEKAYNEFWFLRYPDGDLPLELSAALARQLVHDGVAQATVTADAEGADFLIRGKLVRSTLFEEKWNYGLNAFHIADASFVPHFLGAPYARRYGNLEYAWDLVDAKSGDTVASFVRSARSDSHFEGIWWGGTVAREMPQVGIFKNLVADQIAVDSRELKATLELKARGN